MLFAISTTSLATMFATESVHIGAVLTVSLKCVICRTLCPLSLCEDGSGVLWVVNGAVHYSQQNIRKSLFQASALSSNANSVVDENTLSDWWWKNELGRVVGGQLSSCHSSFVWYNLCVCFTSMALYDSVRHRSNFTLLFKYVLYCVLCIVQGKEWCIACDAGWLCT